MSRGTAAPDLAEIEGKSHGRNDRDDYRQTVEPQMKLPMSYKIAGEVAECHNDRECILAEFLASHHSERIRARCAVAEQEHDA